MYGILNKVLNVVLLIRQRKAQKSSGVKRLIEDAIWNQGLRKSLIGGKKRHEFQVDHGFRKWFKTRCEISGMKRINIEKLMGHSIGISGSYYRATETNFWKIIPLKAIDALTIDNDNMLERQFNKLEEKLEEMAEFNLKIFEKSREIELLHKNDISKDDAIAALSIEVTRPNGRG